ncbi:MAG: hypothetical protein AAGB05_11345 [Pseudomonadota bacterium]
MEDFDPRARLFAHPEMQRTLKLVGAALDEMELDGGDPRDFALALLSNSITLHRAVCGPHGKLGTSQMLQRFLEAEQARVIVMGANAPGGHA